MTSRDISIDALLLKIPKVLCDYDILYHDTTLKSYRNERDLSRTIANKEYFQERIANLIDRRSKIQTRLSQLESMCIEGNGLYSCISLDYEDFTLIFNTIEYKVG